MVLGSIILSIWKIIYLYILVLVYECLDVKHITNGVCTFHNKASEPINNYVHGGGKQQHQEVEDGYIFSKIFRFLSAANNLTYKISIF